MLRSTILLNCSSVSSANRPDSPCSFIAETKASYTIDGNEEIYLNLTKTQYETPLKRANGFATKDGKEIEAIELTQNMFVTYEYESKSVKGKMCVGVGLKSNRPEPKSFDDFDNKEE